MLFMGVDKSQKENASEIVVVVVPFGFCVKTNDESLIAQKAAWQGIVPEVTVTESQ